MSKLTKTKRAIKAAIARAGGPDEVRKARKLKSVQAVYRWIKKGEVPSKHLAHLAELAGMTTDMVLGVGEIYDYFESRTCGSCRFRMSNIDGTLLCMNGKAPDFLLESTVSENFSCSLFDKGEEGEQK